MWGLPDLLEEWFAEVEERYASGRADRDDEPRDAGPMMQNDLAAGRR